MTPEPGKDYMAGDFAAFWLSAAESTAGTSVWMMVRLSTGAFVGRVATVEQLLAEFPEFSEAVEA
jgi:hypothetical protein